MSELFQTPQELVTDLLNTMKSYPDLPVISLPAPKPTAEEKPENQRSKQIIQIDFIELERNLASLGFFSASSKRVKTKKAKTITLTKTINRRKIKVTAMVVPGSIFGLPTVADQEKWFAFCYLLAEHHKKHGKISNPIQFTAQEIFEILGQTRATKNYADLNEWLDVMSATTIVSEGAVYLAGERTWVSHSRRRFHVFDRADSKGTRLDDGTVLDRHQVVLSQWQLQNLNNRHLLLLDHPLYKPLRKAIAKTLLPLLQTWLFAARKDGRFEKRYSELCEVLQITTYHQRSRIHEQLQPALDELVGVGCLAKWEILKTADGKGYKIIFYAGPGAFRTRRRQKTTPEPEAAGAASLPDPQTDQFVEQLSHRGISGPERLVSAAADHDFVADCISYWDTQPNVGPGLLVSLIRRKVALPATFETTTQRRKREAAEQKHRQQQEEEAGLQIAHREHLAQRIQRFIDDHPAEYEDLLAEQKLTLLQQVRKRAPNMKPDLQERLASDTAKSRVRTDIAAKLNLPSLEEFSSQRKAARAANQKPATASKTPPSATLAPEEGPTT